MFQEQNALHDCGVFGEELLLSRPSETRGRPLRVHPEPFSLSLSLLDRPIIAFSLFLACPILDPDLRILHLLFLCLKNSSPQNFVVLVLLVTSSEDLLPDPHHTLVE